MSQLTELLCHLEASNQPTVKTPSHPRRLLFKIYQNQTFRLKKKLRCALLYNWLPKQNVSRLQIFSISFFFCYFFSHFGNVFWFLIFLLVLVSKRFRLRRDVTFTFYVLFRILVLIILKNYISPKLQSLNHCGFARCWKAEGLLLNSKVLWQLLVDDWLLAV